MKPLAMPPAVAASDARSPVPSSLIGRLKTMSARTSDFLERRRARQCQLRLLQGAGDAHPRLDAGVGDLARRGDVDHGVELRVAGEAQRAVPGEVELPALELIRAAHGVHGSRQRDRTTAVLADVEVAAERDVDVAHRGPRRTARPQLPAPRHEVVGNAHVQRERDVREGARRGGGRRARRPAAPPPAGRRLDPARASACRVASCALAGALAVRSADTTSGSASMLYGS